MSSETIYYHYVYRITNKILSKHYYGCRTSKNIIPQNDLGVKYFSSSSDKEFVKDQKENPQNYKYKVIKIFSSRDDAIKLEIKLHNKFDVGKNPSFFNRSKQSSTGFDTSGIKFDDSFKQKISAIRKIDRDIISKRFKGMVNCIEISSGNIVFISTDEYHLNKNIKYIHSSKLKILSDEHKKALSDGRRKTPMTDSAKKAISEKNTGRKFSEEHKKKISETRNLNKEKNSNSYAGENNGMYNKTSIYDKELKIVCVIEKEKYHKNTERYISIQSKEYYEIMNMQFISSKTSRVYAYDKLNDVDCIVSVTEFKENDNLITKKSNEYKKLKNIKILSYVDVYDLIDKIKIRILSEIYKSNKDRYISIHTKIYKETIKPYL